MEDSQLTRLFERMDRHLTQQDAHLAQQDVSLQILLTNMGKQNAVLVEVAQALAHMNRQLEESARESSTFWAAEREAWAELLRELRALRPRPEEDR
jgi:hypothetical protein